MEGVDELSDLLAGSLVDTAPNSTAREHPRFSQYKYTGRAEENQENRRREYLQRQKEMRFDYANHARKLAMNEFDEEDDKMDMEAENEEVDEAEMEEAGSEGKKKKWRKYSKKAKKERIRRNRYANELMLSEWLVDIPTTLSKDWICLPCPTGKRCLVVASNGVTTAYAKTGFMITQFRSYLPGGSRNSIGGEAYTLLDCILSQPFVFYCLDVIAWGGMSTAEADFECRIFMLNSRISENKNFAEATSRFPYRFVCLPYCRCENSLMEEMMHREFEFELDGVLFYHANVRYEKGQSPLVGWLKPWMMPEILSVRVPERLMSGNTVEPGSSQKFIENFNKEHRHSSQVNKPMEQEECDRTDMDDTHSKKQENADTMKVDEKEKQEEDGTEDR